MNYRSEKDLIGEKEVPADAYWGIHTQRALENFTLTRCRVHPGLIHAYAQVKKAACLANQERGYLPVEKAGAIAAACDAVAAGVKDDQFPVDALQGGAGTSTNMNVNEVIANLAIEALGGTKGNYSIVHPLDEVNLHQSTNDTYPTALKVAALYEVKELSAVIEELQGLLQAKEKEYSGIAAIGRTEMREAVPLTLGLEFSGFAEAVARDRWRMSKCTERLRIVPLGGTAVGTGLGAPYDYTVLAIEKLREITGLGLARAENTVDQTANMDVLVEVSGILKAHAVNLMKIADDIRLLSLVGEINLLPVQAGSSIMPGKINPVIPEAVVQAGLKVVANDLLMTSGVSRGNLQISQYMPLIAFALLESLDILIAACQMLARCVAGITANPDICRRYLDQSPGIVTAFVPVIGYAQAEALIAAYDPASGKTLRAYLTEKLGSETVEKYLSPAYLVSSR